MQLITLLFKFIQNTPRRIFKIFYNTNADNGLDFFTLKRLQHSNSRNEQSFTFQNKLIYFFNPKEFLHTYKEIFVQEIYKVKLGANPFIIDCGANIGISTLYFKHRFPDAEIIAFEPDDTNFTVLQKNVKGWKLDNVKCCKQAVWIENTTLNFSNDANMASKISDTESGIEVEAIRFKDIITKKVDFLKIDIESAEFEILKDIKDKLHLVENMFFEYHGHFNQQQNLNDIFKILTDAGFTYYIKEAISIYDNPFIPINLKKLYDIQLNIFCFRKLN